ncbi:MAG: hypothetical protein ACXW37_07390 [Nitrospira sp.]
MSSIKPGEGGGEIDGTKDGGTFVVAGGDGAELPESREQVLNQMPCSVEVLIVFAWGCPVRFGWDDDDLARSLQRLDHPFIGIKGLIGNDRVRIMPSASQVAWIYYSGPRF